MDGGEREGLAAALRARLAAAGIEAPDDGGRLEGDLALHLERLAALAAAADLGPAEALLRLFDLRHGGVANWVWCQIAKASSSNASATRRFVGASTASS